MSELLFFILLIGIIGIIAFVIWCKQTIQKAKEYPQIEKELIDSRKKNEELQKEIHKLKSNQYVYDIQKLQKHLQELTAERDQLKREKELIDSRKKTEELQKDIRKLKSNQYVYDIQKLQKHLQELTTERDQLKRENEDVTHQYQNALQLVTQLQAENNDLSSIRMFSVDCIKHINQQFQTQYDIASFFNGITQNRLNNAFKTGIRLDNLSISVKAYSEESQETYNVSLKSCSCKDYTRRKSKGETPLYPCKHMLYLAYTFDLLQSCQQECSTEKDKAFVRFNETCQNIHDNQKELNVQKKNLSDLEKDIKEKNKKLEQLNQILNEIIEKKCSSYPQIAVLIADLETLYYEHSARHLEKKLRPAHIEAKRIRELKKDTQKVIARNKLLEYKWNYIHELFPNIDDIFDNEFEPDPHFELETEDNTDRTRLYLSHEEYRSLSITERNQLALDRYIKNQKSKWQIGRDYEMYIGYNYEQAGFHVQYTGIIKKLEDMGRDLIATNKNETFIIQCKNWSKEKVIHEKHIFQLYGTVVLYQLSNPHTNCKGVFITTTTLSNTAKKVAEHLGITIIENKPLGEFPRIKCNVNRQTTEKIYHLPFDQQYERVIIDPSMGEFYATTVAEAEALGFRRAMKHYAS